MLIKWGSIVVDGSGKLGGHVFSKGRGGATIRTIARNANPQTTFQQIIRSRFTQLTQGWRNLTETERESWYDAESSFSRTNRFGDVVLLSGKNLYNSLNTNRQILGLGVINLAPLPSEIPRGQVTNVEISLSNTQISLQGDFVSNQNYVVVATKGLSQGMKNFKNEIRTISVRESSSGGTSIGGLSPIYFDYIRRFGTPIDGTKIFMGTYSISVSGQRSPVSMVQAEFV